MNVLDMFSRTPSLLRYDDAMSVHTTDELARTDSLVAAQEAQQISLRDVYALLGPHAIAPDGAPSALLDSQAQQASCTCTMAHVPLTALCQPLFSSLPGAHNVHVPSSSESDAPERRSMVRHTIRRLAGSAWTLEVASVTRPAYSCVVFGRPPTKKNK